MVAINKLNCQPLTANNNIMSNKSSHVSFRGENDSFDTKKGDYDESIIEDEKKLKEKAEKAKDVFDKVHEKTEQLTDNKIGKFFRPALKTVTVGSLSVLGYFAGKKILANKLTRDFGNEVASFIQNHTKFNAKDKLDEVYKSAFGRFSGWKAKMDDLENIAEPTIFQRVKKAGAWLFKNQIFEPAKDGVSASAVERKLRKELGLSKADELSKTLLEAAKDNATGKNLIYHTLGVPIGVGAAGLVGVAGFRTKFEDMPEVARGTMKTFNTANATDLLDLAKKPI